jgi:hypothetical protein
LGEGWDEGRSTIGIMYLNSNPTLTLTLSQRERGLKPKGSSPCPPWLTLFLIKSLFPVVKNQELK